VKPSDILLIVPPLCATFGRTENEVAAALIVRACQVAGDQWAPVKWSTAVDVLKADHEAGREFGMMMVNPFCRPDMFALVDGGFARWIEKGREVEFTEAGLSRIATSRWLMPSKGAEQP